jgi:hypothetical protein
VKDTREVAMTRNHDGEDDGENRSASLITISYPFCYGQSL